MPHLRAIPALLLILSSAAMRHSGVHRSRFRATAGVHHLREAGAPLIFHLNGGFHTNYRLGIVPRLARRRPDLEVRIITAIDIPDPSNPPLDEHRDKADFIIFTRQ